MWNKYKREQYDVTVLRKNIYGVVNCNNCVIPYEAFSRIEHWLRQRWISGLWLAGGRSPDWVYGRRRAGGGEGGGFLRWAQTRCSALKTRSGTAETLHCPLRPSPPGLMFPLRPNSTARCMKLGSSPWSLRHELPGCDVPSVWSSALFQLLQSLSPPGTGHTLFLHFNELAGDFISLFQNVEKTSRSAN